MRPQITTVWPQLSLQQTPARPDITVQGPEMEIDQRQSMGELGLRDFRQFADHQAAVSQHMVHAGIARLAQEGDRAAAEMTSQDVFPRLARARMLSEIPEINVDAAPKTRPRIEFRYSLTVDWDPESLDMHVDIQDPDIHWPVGQYLDTKG